MDVSGALLRGGLAALAVAALLWAAQRWGRDMAGLLAGLPTVTGPAMVWLALDRGPQFAGEAAHGAVAAAVPCALFAWAYACLAPGRRRAAALAGACIAGVLASALLLAWRLPMLAALAVAGLVCVACVAQMPRLQAGAASRLRPGAALRAGATTVLVAGAVSTLASLSAQTLGPHWAGVLTSLPLLAAAVALELHRQGCPARVRDFLRGYTAGLVGRSLFVAVFGALLAPQGLAVALSSALAVALLLGGLTSAWMDWRTRLAQSRQGA